MKTNFLNMVLMIALGFGAQQEAMAGTVAGGQKSPELREVNQLSEQGNQAAALDKVNSFLAGNPKNAEAMFMKGVILVEMGKRDDAIKTFTDLTDKYPNLPEPYNNLAVLYADQGQYDKARNALEMAIKTHPSYATAHENLGDIYARLASESYDKALKIDTSNTRAQNKLAMITDLFGGTKKVISKAGTKPITQAPSPVIAAPVAPVVDAKKPESKPELQSEAKSNDATPAILDAVNDWAAAWSAQNVNKYLNSYAKSFKTPNGASRKSWEDERRERVSKPSKIVVKVSQPKVIMNGDDEATVKFRQSYNGGNIDSTSTKTLTMVKEGGRWLIQREKVGG